MMDQKLLNSNMKGGCLMKKFLGSMAVAAFVFCFSLPAMAEVDVYGEVNKTKDVTITEDVTVTKTVTINVDVDVALEDASEADAVVNQDNFDNGACENCAEKRNLITDNALNGGDGIININQATGNMNNQGNVVSLSVDVGPPPPPPSTPKPGALTHSQAAVEQNNEFNWAHAISILFRDDEISGAAASNVSGILNINQAAGNMNNQANAEAIALGFDAVVALSEADLGQFNTCNTVSEGGWYGVYKSDSISGGAFYGASGVVGVNQAAGNVNNQTNALGMSASISNL